MKIAIASLFLTAALAFIGSTAEASPFVGIPSNYTYNPKLGTLNDYCTKSPDEFPNPFGVKANFRGPCARHDLCFRAKTSKATCNARLRQDMVTNCKHSYGLLNPIRATCIKIANVYWLAVTGANPR
jgi:hypothetical protein